MHRTVQAVAMTVATMMAMMAGVLAGVSHAGAASSFTYTVNSTSDTRDTNLNDHACDSTCTLRGAIEQANVNCTTNPATLTTINFTIPGSGVRTITPITVSGASNNQSHAAPLPGIVCPVVIDGTTQGGAGYVGPPLIELDGSVATADNWQGAGLAFSANTNGSTVRGLVIDRWLGSGVSLGGKGGATAYPTFVVRGNYIGTDPTGTIARPNAGDGISVSGIARATIGGTTAADRNVISGNGTSGAGRGIDFGPGAATGSVVLGNYIGSNAGGTAALPNKSDGIYFNGNNGTIVGGTTAGAGNLISANKGNGIAAVGAGVGSFQVQGNKIGTTANGTGPLANTGFGVAFQNSGGKDLVGGTAPGAANTIAFNGRAGVQVGVGTANRISANSIFANAGLGIDLTPCTNGNCPGPNVNDAGDGDGGANLFQNYPVITTVKSTTTATTITGTLNSTANATFTVEVFSSPKCDTSGYGEGQKFLGSKTVATVGNTAAFTMTVTPPVASGSVVTATATDSAGNTSELSPCRGPLTVAPTQAVAGSVVKLSGNGFSSGATVTLVWNCAVTTCSTGSSILGTVVADSAGTFTGKAVTIPATATSGSYWIGARTAGVFVTVPFTVS